jgi:hypothetical protein
MTPHERSVRPQPAPLVGVGELAFAARRSRPPLHELLSPAVGRRLGHPDGRLLAVGGWDGTATVWDVRSRTRLGGAPRSGRGNPSSRRCCSKPRGRLLITELGRAVEWPLDRPTLRRFACQIAGRDLTRDEWTDILPNRTYHPVC